MECQCYNHTPTSLAKGIAGVRCQRLAKWALTMASNTVHCCNKHKEEMLRYNPDTSGIIEYDNGRVDMKLSIEEKELITVSLANTIQDPEQKDIQPDAQQLYQKLIVAWEVPDYRLEA